MGTVAWKIPWMEEPGRLQSMGLHRVGHDWSDLAAAAMGLKLWRWLLFTTWPSDRIFYNLAFLYLITFAYLWSTVTLSKNIASFHLNESREHKLLKHILEVLQSWSKRILRSQNVSEPTKKHFGIDQQTQFYRRIGTINILKSIHSTSVQSLSHVQLLRPHEAQHARPPCPSPTPGILPNSCPLSQWCHPAISSSVVLFSSCTQSLPASESFPMINSSHEVAKVLQFQL